MQKESLTASSSTLNSITYADFSWRYIQICTHCNEIIVQQWPIILIQDVVTFGVSGIMQWFYFRNVKLSILGKTRQGAGPLTILVSGLWQAEPHRPVAKQQGDWMLTPRGTYLARQIEECRHWQQIQDAGNGLKDPTAPIIVLGGSPVTPTPGPYNTIQWEYNWLRGENRGPSKGQQASASNPVMIAVPKTNLVNKKPRQELAENGVYFCI